MTMLFGWASAKETQPLRLVGEAFATGAAELDRIDRRGIVEGRAGTVLGLSFQVSETQMQRINELHLTRPIQPDSKIGLAAKLSKPKHHLPIQWLTLRSRVNKPESIEKLLEVMNLAELETRGAFGIMTRRHKVITPETLDSSAPVETLPLFIAGTVGQISVMLRENPEMGITPGAMDGRQLLRKINKEMPICTLGVDGSAMAQYTYLKKRFCQLPYSLHWIVLDPLLQFVHAIHSKEYGGVTRSDSYLWLGRNKPNKLVAFASKNEMFPPEFGTLELIAPPEGTVKTVYVR